MLQTVSRQYSDTPVVGRSCVLPEESSPAAVEFSVVSAPDVYGVQPSTSNVSNIFH